MNLVTFYLKALADPLCLFFAAVVLLTLNRWRSRKYPLYAALILLYLLSLRPVSISLTRLLEVGCPANTRSLESLSAVVVLGGGVSDGGLWDAGQLSPETAIRLVQGIQIFHTTHADHLVLSGGQLGRNSFSEAQVMADISRTLGVSDKGMILEDRSMNTHDQAVRVSQLEPLHSGRVALVTSSVHMRRAEMNFRSHFNDLALAPVGCSANAFTKSPLQLIPAVRNLQASTWVLYEVLGLMKDKILTKMEET